MSMTDPVADFLARVRNGLVADHEHVEIPSSKFKEELARILEEQGYIEGFSVEPARVGRVLRIRLKYTPDRRPVITGLRHVSRPGRRYYVPAGRVPRLLGGKGPAIISTPRGVMTDQEARRAGVGGAGVAQVV